MTSRFLPIQRGLALASISAVFNVGIAGPSKNSTSNEPAPHLALTDKVTTTAQPMPKEPLAMPLTILPQMPWRYDNNEPSFAYPDRAGYYHVVWQDADGINGCLLVLPKDANSIVLNPEHLKNAQIFKIAPGARYDAQQKSLSSPLIEIKADDPAFAKQAARLAKAIAALQPLPPVAKDAKNPSVELLTRDLPADQPPQSTALVLSQARIDKNPNSGDLTLTAVATPPRYSNNELRGLWRAALPVFAALGQKPGVPTIRLDIDNDQSGALDFLVGRYGTAAQQERLDSVSSFTLSDGAKIPLAIADDLTKPREPSKAQAKAMDNAPARGGR